MPWPMLGVRRHEHEIPRGGPRRELGRTSPRRIWLAFGRHLVPSISVCGTRTNRGMRDAKTVDGVAGRPAARGRVAPGSVTDGTGAINCPGTCSAEYTSGQYVLLTETPQSGQAFGGWSTTAPVISGCSATSNTCETGIGCDQCSRSEAVTATFEPILNIGFSGGKGAVSGLGNSSCTSGSCSYTASPGQEMTLTATAASDYQFGGWSGGECAGQGATCTFTITQSDTETALFTQKENVDLDFGAPPDVPLGSVTDSTGAINCPGTCRAQFPTDIEARSRRRAGSLAALIDCARREVCCRGSLASCCPCRGLQSSGPDVSATSRRRILCPRRVAVHAEFSSVAFS